MTNRLRTGSAVPWAAGLLLGCAGGLACCASAAEPPPAKPDAPAALTAATFAAYQKQIKPQPGESRWMELAWFTDLHEARLKAAAEGKALFIYSAGGGTTAIGLC